MPTLNNPTSLQALREALKQAVAEVERRYEVKLNFDSRITFQRDGSSAAMKLQMIGTHSGSPIAAPCPFAVEWHKKQRRLGLSSYKIGDEFQYGTHTFEIVGLKPRTNLQNLVVRNKRTQKLHRMSLHALAGVVSYTH